MIDICVSSLSMLNLKEDIGHFRNLCQHANMNLLESVLKHLRNKAESLIDKLEEREGVESLAKILSSENNYDNFLIQDPGEANPDDLLLYANCDLDEIETQDKIIPVVLFFTESCKIILDVLRQNSRMLEFYNMTAQKCFEFCVKYQCKREYRKVSETLHSHFNQILKQSKHPDPVQLAKIPFPVKLEEEECHQKLLDLRYEQLKVALRMKEWSDAFRTSENIYQLINRQKHNASKMKAILYDFFFQLQTIFWQSEFYLFHAYAMMNIQQITKSNRNMKEDEKMKFTAKFVLAVLSISLNNRISNFEKLSVQYVPQGMMNESEESNTSAKNEIY